VNYTIALVVVVVLVLGGLIAQRVRKLSEREMDSHPRSRLATVALGFGIACIAGLAGAVVNLSFVNALTGWYLVIAAIVVPPCGLVALVLGLLAQRRTGLEDQEILNCAFICGLLGIFFGTPGFVVVVAVFGFLLFGWGSR
jgi:hypothetical protein